MEALNITSILNKIPVLNITANTTAEEADGAFGEIAKFEQYTLGVMRFSGLTPWEKHDHDEMLHILDGEVEVTILTEGEPAQFSVSAGSVCIVPKGLWHRQLPKPVVTLLSATSTHTTKISFADDPRVE
jgi:mannose-6-phosphate isomerase-like protein (cupin superfamily)